MTLRTGTREDIVQMFNMLAKSSKALIRSIVEIVYFMRGAIQYEDAMWRTPFEREVMIDFIQDRLEIEKKNMYPTY